jgi:hypothetical protein
LVLHCILHQWLWHNLQVEMQNTASHWFFQLWIIKRGKVMLTLVMSCLKINRYTCHNQYAIYLTQIQTSACYNNTSFMTTYSLSPPTSLSSYKACTTHTEQSWLITNLVILLGWTVTTL